MHSNGELFLAEMLPFLLNIRLLFGAGGIKPAAAYECDNAAQFVTVKPVPWPLQMSTITPEQRAKLIRFINCEHSGQGM